MSIIRVEHMEKSFGNETPFKDISFEINQGDVIAVIGPSGTGKSTLLRALNMLDAPTGGKIYFHDVCVNDGTFALNRLRERVGMVFQSFNLFSHKTVMENIIMAPVDLLGVSREEAEADAVQLLKEVGLLSKRDSYPDELSGGQKQRIAIARCLAMNPEVILFDEPTSALDTTMVNEAQAIIRRLSEEGKTMMIVTHDIEFARNAANRVFYLDQGGIYEEGTPGEIFDHPKKERTIAFMKRTKNFNRDIDVSDMKLSELLDSLMEYARKNDISKNLTYRLLLLVEEALVSIVAGHVENAERTNLFIEYQPNEESVRVNFYTDGTINERMQYDDLSRKMFDSYGSKFNITSHDDGYDLHIAFEVR